jgi:hypothetical protein
METADIAFNSSKESQVKFFSGNQSLYSYEQKFYNYRYRADYGSQEEMSEELINKLKIKYNYSDFSDIEVGKYVGELPMMGTDKGSSSPFGFNITCSGGDGGYIEGVRPVEIEGAQYTRKPVYHPINNDLYSKEGQTIINNGNYNIEFVKELDQEDDKSEKKKDIEMPKYKHSPKLKTNNIAEGVDDRGTVPMIVKLPDNDEGVEAIWIGSGAEIDKKLKYSDGEDEHVVFRANSLPVTDLIEDYKVVDTTGREIVIRGNSIKTFEDFQEEWENELANRDIKIKKITQYANFFMDKNIDPNLLRMIDLELQRNPQLRDININLYTAEAAVSKGRSVIAQWNNEENALELSEYLTIDWEGFTNEFIKADRVLTPTSIIDHELNHGATYKVIDSEKEQAKEPDERYAFKVDQLVLKGFENIRNNPEQFLEEYNEFLAGMGVNEGQTNEAISRFKNSNYSPEILMNAVYGTIAHEGGVNLTDEEIKTINMKKEIMEKMGYNQEFIDEYVRKQVYPGGLDVFDGVVRPKISDQDYSKKLDVYERFTKYFQKVTGLASFYACDKMPSPQVKNDSDATQPLYPEVTTTFTERGKKVNLDKFLNGSEAEQKTLKNWIDIEFKAGVQTFMDYAYYMRHIDNRYQEVFDNGYIDLEDIEKIEDNSTKERMLKLYEDSIKGIK